MIEHPCYTPNYIVDVGEVPLHLPVVKNLDGLSGKNRFCEKEQRHIRATVWSVNGEKPETCCWYSEQMTISVCHQFVTFLGGKELFQIITVGKIEFYKLIVWIF